MCCSCRSSGRDGLEGCVATRGSDALLWVRVAQTTAEPHSRKHTGAWPGGWVDGWVDAHRVLGRRTRQGLRAIGHNRDGFKFMAVVQKTVWEEVGVGEVGEKVGEEAGRGRRWGQGGAASWEGHPSLPAAWWCLAASPGKQELGPHALPSALLR